MRYGLTSYIQQKMKKKRLDELFLKMFFWVKLDLNFGHFGDNIYSVDMLDNNDEDLTDFYLKWKGYRDNMTLNVYIINLTSGGKIKIIAKGFRIE